MFHYRTNILALALAILLAKIQAFLIDPKELAPSNLAFKNFGLSCLAASYYSLLDVPVESSPSRIPRQVFPK